MSLVTPNRRARVLQRNLREAQRLLQDVLEYMADGFALYDDNGVIQLCNSQYQRLFPITADLRIPGTQLSHILRAAVERGEQALLAGENLDDWLRERCTLIGQEGERIFGLSDGRWIESRTRRIENVGTVVLLHDVTSRITAEQALERVNNRLAVLAMKDGLTGLANRHSFDLALEREFARSTSDGRPLNLLLLDIDRFKLLNDVQGHLKGDACLRAVGAKIRSLSLWPADLAGRYGGEEFAVLLPNVTPSAALQLAESLLGGIRSLALPHPSGSIVTASIGVATLNSADAGSADLVQRADDALYAAKAAGRDQVFAAPPIRLCAKMVTGDSSPERASKETKVR